MLTIHEQYTELRKKVHILKKVILSKFKLDIQILYKIQLGIVHLTPEGC